ncbi:MAG: peptidylprolyl isomerase [Planctomycetota bacterium]
MTALLVASIVSLVARFEVPQDSAPVSDRTAIEHRVNELYAALSNKNWTALRDCFLKEAIVILPNGIAQKADEVIQNFEAGKYPASPETPVHVKVTFYDDVATAWVISRGTELGKDGGGAAASASPTDQQAVDLFLLARREGAWKIASIVSTLAKENLPLESDKDAAARSEASGQPAGQPTAAGDAATAAVPAAKDAATEVPSKESATPTEAEATEPVAILTTTQGEVTIRLYPKEAPEHVKNFVEHIKNDRYTGTYFHRVYPGKFIQGGDFNTKDDNKANDGMGGFSYKGPTTTLKFEKNNLKHERGTVSMARNPKELDSAKSQFFILLGPAKSYDGQYTIFGHVIAGIEAIEAIAKQPGKELKIGGVNPDVEQKITAARVENWPLSKIDELLKKMDVKN